MDTTFLDGSIILEPLDSYTPQAGDSFEVLVASATVRVERLLDTATERAVAERRRA